jgi:hypothetical protein
MFDENTTPSEALYWDRGTLTAHKIYTESTPQSEAIEAVQPETVDAKTKIISIAC